MLLSLIASEALLKDHQRFCFPFEQFRFKGEILHISVQTSTIPKMFKLIKHLSFCSVMATGVRFRPAQIDVLESSFSRPERDPEVNFKSPFIQR